MIKIFFIWFLGFVYSPDQVQVTHSKDICITTENGGTFILMEGALACNSNEFSGTLMYPKLYKRGNSIMVYSAKGKPILRFFKGAEGITYYWYNQLKPYER